MTDLIDSLKYICPITVKELGSLKIPNDKRKNYLDRKDTTTKK